MAEVPASFGLTKRTKGDGTLDLVGKDDTGQEYVARNCKSGGVTEDDLQELVVGDRTQSTARAITDRVVNRRESFKREHESQIEDAIAENMGEVVYAGFHGFWGKGYGKGEAARSANGAAIPSRRRFRFDAVTSTVVEY